MEDAALEALVVRLASYFTGREDVDIVVYFTTGTSIPDIESDYRPAGEEAVWLDLEVLCGREVDLLVLNRAPVDPAAEVLHSGVALAVNNRALYWRYFLPVTAVAEDFRHLISDFVEIKARSRSLNETERARLLRILDFLRTEVEDASILKSDATLEQFEADHAFRRNIERWVENPANPTIDVAKIILAASDRAIPRTYRAVVLDLKQIEGFQSIDSDLLASCAQLRSLLAHEYLDLRYERTSKIVARKPELHLLFVELVQGCTEDYEGGPAGEP